MLSKIGIHRRRFDLSFKEHYSNIDFSYKINQKNTYFFIISERNNSNISCKV